MVLLNDFANLISKKRNELMGLATIMTVLFHMRIPMGGPLDSFRGTLDVGVDIFLLLSGMGCAVSLHKNDTKNPYQ